MHPDWQDKLHLYCEQNSSPEQQYLKDVTAFTWRNMLNARQLSGKLQGQLLSMLVALKNPQCILEIGTFTGYATACLTENASQETQIHTIEADLETAFKTKSFWKNYNFMNKVQFHEGPALEILPPLNLNPDFIFAFPAYNTRNTEIGGILGRSQLKRLDKMVEVRNDNLKTFLKSCSLIKVKNLETIFYFLNIQRG